MKFVVAQKNGPQGLLLIVTDQEILGQKFEEGKRQLDLSPAFYQGKAMSREEVKKLLSQAQHLHLTGTRAVALALEEDLICSKNILWIQGVPHVEVVMG
ncbi:MAG: DUF424 family protein [Nanoarchaeota archaeon]